MYRCDFVILTLIRGWKISSKYEQDMEKSLQSRDTIRTKKIFSFLSARGKSEEKLLRNPFCVKEFKNVRECSMLPEEEVRQSTKRVGWSDTLPQNPF